ncbi:MAG: nucleotidyltransferase family protein [Kiloniellales bacterium]|nr:nucleotidyltransferase family protein [Kiloniellales bacterium]
MSTTADRVIEIFAAAPWRLDALRAVAALGLPDCWAAAGVLRNPIWDSLHGYAAATPLNDLDMVYFDPKDHTKERDRTLEAELRKLSPGLPWSIRNQARMHHTNGDRPYTSTEDALRHWLETVSAVGIRLTGTGELELLAPFGFDDIFALTVRPTPHARAKRSGAYRARMARKNWPATWPRVNVLAE